jgi:hypothetical protein
LKKGYVAGLKTGPTEFSWTSTLTAGRDAEWGVLTLTDEASTTDTLDITATAMLPLDATQTGNGIMTNTPLSQPAQTGLAIPGKLLASRWIFVASTVTINLVIAL